MAETRGSKSDSEYKPQTEQKHPDEYERDLNPNRMAGQNIGVQSAADEIGVRTAYDVKPLHRDFDEWNDADLKRIPILPEGQRLEQGATYLDMRDPERGEFTATGEMSAGGATVPKARVAYPTWNRLRGVSDPDRL